MKNLAKKGLATLVAATFLLSALGGCTKPDTNEPGVSTTPGATTPSTATYPVEPEELGSGTVKWAEEKTQDGWMQVANEGGDTLGYASDSGVKLIQVEGFAFKDLNRNGKLDAYEDWRQDDVTRATDLASQMSGEEIAPLMTHGGWASFGSTIEGTDLEYIQAGGRAGVTRSAANRGNTAMAVTWTNALQALSEATGNFGIPVTISVDPCNVSGLIDQNAMAATMDADVVHEIAVETAKEYRTLGITMLLGPQIDIATNSTWCRASGTYSEDPALNRDLAAAFIDGLQSTYDESGKDLGWGKDSVIAIAKHYVGAGSSEGGRNDHFDGGKYTVYPGNNFAAHLIPFFDGAFNLAGSTKVAGGVMPNYAIAYNQDDSLGDLVGGAYSEFKINLLRDNGYDGFILTDWGIVTTQAFGKDILEMTEPERFCALYKLGVDQVGGSSDIANATEGYNLLVEDLGEDAALAQIRESARRFFTTQMEVGLYENPYVTKDNAAASVYSESAEAYALKTQEQSVIMLKNSENVIHKYDAAAEKPTVYVPYTCKTSGNSWMGYTYNNEPVFDIDLLSPYYNVVTDSTGEPSGTNDKGEAIYTANDIIRASAADVATCDFALVNMNAPFVESAYNEETGTWAPASIQYEEYTANSASVKKESIAGDMVLVEGTNVYGTYTSEEKENRSYYGNTAALPTSYSDYENLKYVKSVVPASCKIIVTVAAQAPMVWSEVEPLADGILLYYGLESFTGSWFSDVTLVNIITGQAEPSALLPMQQPASMEAVEKQLEDVPRDVECYVDANGNTYDFTFGLNWSGVISDERTQKYNVPALTTPETITID